MESLVLDRIMPFLERKGVFNDRQFGFTRGRSRVEALLNNKVCSVHTETCGTILGILVKAVKNDKYSPYLIEK